MCILIIIILSSYSNNKVLTHIIFHFMENKIQNKIRINYEIIQFIFSCLDADKLT